MSLPVTESSARMARICGSVREAHDGAAQGVSASGSSEHLDAKAAPAPPTQPVPAPPSGSPVSTAPFITYSDRTPGPADMLGPRESRLLASSAVGRCAPGFGNSAGRVCWRPRHRRICRGGAAYGAVLAPFPAAHDAMNGSGDACSLDLRELRFPASEQLSHGAFPQFKPAGRAALQRSGNLSLRAECTAAALVRPARKSTVSQKSHMTGR